jgi:hypothetical protein
MALLPPTRPGCDDDSPWIKCSRLFSWSNRSLVASEGEQPKASSISKVAGYGLNDCNSILGRGKDFFSSSHQLQPQVAQWLSWILIPRVDQPMPQPDHSPPPQPSLRMNGVLPPIPHTFSWCVAYTGTTELFSLFPLLCEYSEQVGIAWRASLVFRIYPVKLPAILTWIFRGCPQ